MFAIWCFISTAMLLTQATDPLDAYSHTPAACVRGNNIARYESKTESQCAQLCTDYGAGCLGFEIYANHGGSKGNFKQGDCQLSSSAALGACNGSKFNLDFYTKAAVNSNPMTLVDTLDTLHLWSQAVSLDTAVSCSEFSWLENCAGSAGASVLPTNDDVVKFTAMVSAKYYALTGVDPDLTVAPTPNPTFAPTHEPTSAAKTWSVLGLGDCSNANGGIMYNWHFGGGETLEECKQKLEAVTSGSWNCISWGANMGCRVHVQEGTSVPGGSLSSFRHPGPVATVTNRGTDAHCYVYA